MSNLPKHHGAGPDAAASVESAEGRPCLPLSVSYLIAIYRIHSHHLLLYFK